MRDIDYGTVRIKLNELIEQQGISKNRLAHRAEMQRTQLNQYCKCTDLHDYLKCAAYTCFYCYGYACYMGK